MTKKQQARFILMMPQQKKWTQKKSDMPIARYGATTVIYNDKIYVLGGSNTTNVNQVDVYDPSSDTWVTDEAFPTSRKHPFAAVFNEKIYLFGGYIDSSISNLIEAYPNYSEHQPEPSDERAILTITMITGLEKEFDLSMDEVNAFITWYDAKDAGSGPSKYAINKHKNNIGPFSKRTDYVIFNNILTFEVNEYNTVTTATY
ncbi:hypothetical protein HMSSN036_24020 [Paenibacillus macerans]|nr:hypothetical protein HMSSN036_24020 [Paenibacillus macerans]